MKNFEHLDRGDIETEELISITEASAVTIEAEVEAEMQRIIPEAFSVRSSETASWVLRRLCAARRYGEQVKLWAEKERRRAEAEERRLLHLFEPQLRDWAEVEITKFRGRRKSIALPGGTLGFRTVPTRIAVQDEPTVLDWAKKACPLAVVITERLLRTPVNQHFERTGEVPPGAVIVPADTTFYIR